MSTEKSVTDAISHRAASTSPTTPLILTSFLRLSLVVASATAEIHKDIVWGKNIMDNKSFLLID